SKLTTLHAEITDNAWAPYQAPLLDYYRPMDPDVSNANKNPWNGFLSLFRPEDKVIEYENSQDFSKDLSQYNGISMRYWEAKSRGKRDYVLIEGEHDSETNGKYHVSKDADGDLHLLMPIFTRAKNILTRTAYTGNNPFVAYQRKAIIKLTGQLEDGRMLEKNARVMQVRRVVNPKGIWRDYNNDADFHVVLMRLPRESDEFFEEFTSEGKWRAYPLVDKNNLVSLDGVNDTVKGNTGTPIDFTIHFNGTCTASQNRCAIIRVEYHDYNCSHLIFVRQGRIPIDMLGDGKTYWHTYNMRTVDSEASCPLEEGSMFKFGNWDQPIDAVNNVETDFVDRSGYLFSIAGKQTTAYWKNITSQRASDGYFSAPKIDAFVPGKTVSVASLADFNALWESKVIGNAYGVMYGNDATKTLKKVNEVYGHRRDRHLSNGEGYGMRGVFVYNTSTGDNLFFPIGATGYGRRRHSDGNGGKGTAVLRYASRNKPMDTGNPSGSPDWVNFRPLFYDLYRRPGAIYWAQRNETVSRTTGNITGIGWDVNYFTFDFNYLPASNVYGATGQPANTSDACFVRCVEK
ncbi:MAG: DUF4906 domain-containing protein, partial [Odoribacter sp.]|nr:DUF4906 domain-containing protein [Odoribacter sp.]